MKKTILFCATSLLLLSGCGNYNPSTSEEKRKEFVKDELIGDVESDNALTVDILDDIEVSSDNASDITDLSLEGIAYDATNKLFTITGAGEFVFKGEFEGNIVVDVGDDDEVKLTLSGFKIRSTKDAPIKCLNGSELQVSLKKGTSNFIYDMRPHKVEDDDEQGEGAITCNCDTKISGKGSLNLVGNYNNGVFTKDDLTIKPEVNDESKVQFKSFGTTLKGNDNVEIESGNIVVISTQGNGIATKNSDISKKGNQRGNITISSGQVDIYAAKDGMDASYNVKIYQEEEMDAPIVNVYTLNFSSYSEVVAKANEDKLYFDVSFYDGSFDIVVEFLDCEYKTSWVKAEYSDGSTGDHNYFAVDRPDDFAGLKVFAFNKDVTKYKESDARAKMNKFVSVNPYYDLGVIKVFDGDFKLTSWTNYNYSYRDETIDGIIVDDSYSAKGMKAKNIIEISSGYVFVKTYDDAIHADHGKELENDEIGLGNINISGGEITIYSVDDAIHADNSALISGGKVDVKKSYEGLEANFITINGGETRIYANNDGLNSSRKINQTPSITVNDGLLDITVYGQDVDAIDSNGSYTQNGGIVIVKGAPDRMSSALDCEGTITIVAGTFISFGKIEKDITKGDGLFDYVISGDFGVCNYAVVFPDESEVFTSTKFEYSDIYVYSSIEDHVVINTLLE